MVESVDEFNFCDFCFNKFNFNQPYHYCYYCSIFYCIFCLNTFQKTDRNNLQLMGVNYNKLRVVDNPKHLQKICDERKSAIVVFYRPNTSASVLFLDQIAYLITAFISLSKPLPEIYILNVSKKEFQPLLQQLQIDRTPTTVIFNSKMKSQVTIIGASFHDIESLLKVKDRIAKGQPKGLSLVYIFLYRNALSVILICLPKQEKIRTKISARSVWILVKSKILKMQPDNFSMKPVISSAKQVMCVAPIVLISVVIGFPTTETIQVALIFPINLFLSLQFARKTMTCSQLLNQFNINVITAIVSIKEMLMKISVIVKSAKYLCASNVNRRILRIIRISSINHYC